MPKDHTTKEFRQKCNACDFQKLNQLENNPAVRKLRDKIEQLSFRLTECKNENQMLKRNLQLAKKMVYQEMGANDVDFNILIKHGTEHGWKARQESLLLLKNKVHELKNYLKWLEGDLPTPEQTRSEEYVKHQMPTENKKLWRMELERRLARASAEKDIIPLSQECAELRRILDSEKHRFKELSEEVKLLRAELQSQVNKNEEDIGIMNSFKTLEIQLQEILSERVQIRKDLESSRSRNKILAQELKTLQDELEMLQKKTDDNNALINSLTSSHKSIQEAIDSEKLIVKQNVERYKEDLKLLQENHHIDMKILDHLQCIVCDRNDLVDKLNKYISGDLKNIEEEKKSIKSSISKNLNKLAVKEPRASFEIKNGKISSNDNNIQFRVEKNKQSKIEKNKKTKVLNQQPNASKSIEQTDNALETISKDKNVMDSELTVHRLRLECTKYKILCDASNMISKSLPQFIMTQDSKMNDFAVQVVETGRLTMQKNAEKKKLLEKINRLQRITAAVKHRKGKSRFLPKSKIDELRIKCAVQKDENDFLRQFLRSAVCEKAKDLQIIKGFIDETNSFFQTSLNDIKESFKANQSVQSDITLTESINE